MNQWKRKQEERLKRILHFSGFNWVWHKILNNKELTATLSLNLITVLKTKKNAKY
jgi:hypothetical protein